VKNAYDELTYICDHVPMSRLRHSRILMTGATGFIGGWLKDALTYYGNSPICLRSDLFYIADCDYFIHCAPISIIPFHVSTGKTLFLSSGAVYDKQPSEYGQLKIDTENQLMPTDVSARIFTTYGPRMKDHFVISRFIRNAIDGKPLTVMGQGSSWRSYMYIADLCVWLLKLMLDGQGAYDVGSDNAITIRDLAKEVASHFLPKPAIEFDGKEFIDPRPNYIPNTIRAKQMGCYSYYGLWEGVERTIEWMRNER
jgi:nucleoside-diphosphate-sugar epimerase